MKRNKKAWKKAAVYLLSASLSVTTLSPGIAVVSADEVFASTVDAQDNGLEDNNTDQSSVESDAIETSAQDTSEGSKAESELENEEIKDQSEKNGTVQDEVDNGLEEGEQAENETETESEEAKKDYELDEEDIAASDEDEETDADAAASSDGEVGKSDSSESEQTETSAAEKEEEISDAQAEEDKKENEVSGQELEETVDANIDIEELEPVISQPEEKEVITILEFLPLEDTIYSFDEKPELDELLRKFPSKLSATVEVETVKTVTNEDGEKEEQEITEEKERKIDVTWSCSEDYEDTDLDEYLFTAEVDSERYDPGEARAPEITVQIGEETEIILTAVTDGVEVKVIADPGVLPSDVTLKARKITAESTLDTVKEAIEAYEKENGSFEEDAQTPVSVEQLEVFDVTLLDENGEEIQPDTSKGTIRVSFRNLSIAEEAGLEELEVYHFETDENSKVEKEEAAAEDNTVACEVEHFSTFAVALATAGETVVKIGDTPYSSLAAALEAAQDGETLDLQTDIEVSDTVSITKGITLNGNGKKIFGSVPTGKSFISVKTDGSFELKDCIITPTTSVTPNAAIYLEVKGKVTVTGCTFGDTTHSQVMYNGLEFSQEPDYKLADGSEISGNTFYGYSFRHNCISFYQIAKDAEISISKNKFVDLKWDDTNAVRVSNYGNATAILNLEENEYSVSGEGTDFTYAGLLLFQNNEGLCNTLTVNIKDLKVNGKIVTENGTGTRDQVYYVFKNVKDGTPVVNFGTGIVSIDEKTYVSVAKALEASKENDTIRLIADVQEDVVIPSGKKVTIDLNGHKLTNKSSHTILNKGFVEIVDDGTVDDGTVDNITHARAALYNDTGATAVLSGGEFTRSKENGQSSTDNGGNSYYAILNHGTMTINDGVKVTQSGHYSSLLENGWQDGNQKPSDAEESILTIHGGTFSGGINTIKNDDYGQLVINDGTFENMTQHALLNWNVAKINGGSFTVNGASGIAMWCEYLNDTMDKGQLTITGGTVNGSLVRGNDKATILITGGTFSKKPEDTFIQKDYVAKKNTDGTYTIGEQKALIKITIGGETKEYYTVLEAMESLGAGQTVTMTLVADVTDDIQIPSGVTVVLDLNGYVLNGDITVNGAAEITGGTVDGMIAVKKNGANAPSLKIIDGTYQIDWDVEDASYVDISGGFFSTPVPEEYCADGFVPKQTEDGRYYTVGAVIQNEEISSGGQILDTTGLDTKVDSEKAKEEAVKAAQAAAGAAGTELTGEQQAALEQKLEEISSEAALTEKKGEIVAELTNNENVKGSEPEGLDNAFDAEKYKNSSNVVLHPETKQLELSVQVTVPQVIMEPVVTDMSDLDNIQVGLKATGIVFEVSPQVKQKAEDGTELGSSRLSNQFLNGEEITFRLPIPSIVTEPYVKVIHKSSTGNEIFYKEILGTAPERYVEITVTHFSEFELIFTETKPDDTSGSSSGSSGGSSRGGSSVSGKRHDSKKGWVSYTQGIITGEGSSYSKWQSELSTDGSIKWKLIYADGTMAVGSMMQRADGTVFEQPAWEMINGAWYPFGADGYVKDGWVQDELLGGAFYVDINSGMVTGWQFIENAWYYFNPVSDGTKGIMRRNTWIDGWFVGEDGKWNNQPKAANQ